MAKSVLDTEIVNRLHLSQTQMQKTRLKHSFSLHKDTAPPQPNHTVTPTHIEPEQHNPWNNATNKSQAPKDGYTNIQNMLSIK